MGMQVLAEPPPWDEKGEYNWKNVEVFMETLTGGLVKVGKKVPLGEVLGGGKVQVLDDLVKLMVVPRERREAWMRSGKIGGGEGSEGGEGGLWGVGVRCIL